VNRNKIILGRINVEEVLKTYDPIFGSELRDFFDYEILDNHIRVKAKNKKYTSPIFTKGISSNFRTETVKLPRYIILSPESLIVSGICKGDSEEKSGTFGSVTPEYIKLVWNWSIDNEIPLLGIGVTVKTELLKKHGKEYFVELAHKGLLRVGINVDKNQLFPRENERQGEKIRWEVWIKNVGRILQHIHEGCFKWAVLSTKPGWLETDVQPSTILFKIPVSKFLKETTFFKCKHCERWVDSKRCPFCGSLTSTIKYVIEKEFEDLLVIRKKRSDVSFPIKKEIPVTPKLFAEVGWILAEGNTNNLGCLISNKDEKDDFVDGRAFLDFVETVSTTEILQNLSIGRICWEIWMREIFDNFKEEFGFKDALELLFDVQMVQQFSKDEIMKKPRSDPLRKCYMLLQRLCDIGFLKEKNGRYHVIKRLEKSLTEVWNEDLNYWTRAFPQLLKVREKFSKDIGKAGQNTDVEKWVKENGLVSRNDGTIYKEISMSSSSSLSPLMNKRAPGSLIFTLAFDWPRLKRLSSSP
jgi:RNA polymerase subunit RPABC4/transcription elongation factor Spt4